jgi:hypothetical protein
MHLLPSTSACEHWNRGVDVSGAKADHNHRRCAMLTADERELVEEKLLDILSNHGQPRQLLVTYLHQDLVINLPEGTLAVIVPRAVQLAEKDAYKRKPAALVYLLEGLIPDDEQVAAIVERVKTPPPSVLDPFEARVLRTKQPFIDRKQTRASLKALIQETPVQPVVVIAGDSGLGKTYTFDFIDHISSSESDILHCLVKVEPGQGASIGPAELARDIVASISMSGDLSREPPATTNIEAYTLELAKWIISVAGQSGQRWWFVLDGFNQNELRNDTRSLIVNLASRLLTGIARRRHRLILLDFDRRNLLVPPGLIASETITGIPRSAVEFTVSELVKASGQPLDAAQISAKVLDGFADPVTNLVELNKRVADVIAVVGV